MADAFSPETAPTETALSPWINGTSMPGIDNAYMLSVVLGVRPEWLVLNIGEMTDESRQYDERPYERPPGEPAESKQKPRRVG
jgi:hypothetical protein